MVEAKDLTKPDQVVAAVVNLSQSVSQLKTEVAQLQKREEELALAQTQTASKPGGTAEAASGHSFCGESKCPACAPVVNKAYQMGQEGVMAIPGVKEAVDYHQTMAKMGYEGQSWYQVPQLASAVQMYLLMMTSLDTPVEVG